MDEEEGFTKRVCVRKPLPSVFPRPEVGERHREAGGERGRKQLLEREQLQSRAARRQRDTELQQLQQLQQPPHGKTPPTSDRQQLWETPTGSPALHFLFFAFGAAPRPPPSGQAQVHCGSGVKQLC